MTVTFLASRIPPKMFVMPLRSGLGRLGRLGLGNPKPPPPPLGLYEGLPPPRLGSVPPRLGSWKEGFLNLPRSPPRSGLGSLGREKLGRLGKLGLGKLKPPPPPPLGL